MYMNKGQLAPYSYYLSQSSDLVTVREASQGRLIFAPFYVRIGT